MNDAHAEHAAIEIAHLTKRYGSFVAVDDVSLTVPRGSVCGLLGPNGSGKTTTFKCLLGFARADAGTIAIDGRALEPQTFERLAFVPERPALFEKMTVAEHLETYRRLHRSFDAKRAADLIAQFELDPRKRVKRLSKGMKTALGVVLAFSLRPEILVLDEPTSGLDPIHQRQVLDLVIEAAASGSSVLFASHQIAQVERAADRVAIIRRGKLILSAETDALRASEKIVQAMFEGPLPSLNGLSTDPRVRKVEESGRLLRLQVRDDSEGVARELTVLGAKTVDITDVGLEEIFIGLMGDNA